MDGGHFRMVRTIFQITFSVDDVRRQPLTHVAPTNQAYTYNWETSTRKAKATNTPLQCWLKRTKAALRTSRRRMSPPARQTPPLQTIGSLARKGGAPDQGAEVYTVLDAVFRLLISSLSLLALSILPILK